MSMSDNTLNATVNFSHCECVSVSGHQPMTACEEYLSPASAVLSSFIPVCGTHIHNQDLSC